MVSLRVQASFLVLFLCQSLVLAAAVKEDTNNKHGNIQMPKSHRHQRRHLRETMERVKRSHLQKMQQSSSSSSSKDCIAGMIVGTTVPSDWSAAR